MTEREQRVINAFCNCVRNGEFTEDYAITLIEDDQRYGWLTDAAKDVFYDFLDSLAPVVEPEPEQDPEPEEPAEEVQEETPDQDPEQEDSPEEPAEQTDPVSEPTDAETESEGTTQEDVTETEPEAPAGGEGE